MSEVNRKLIAEVRNEFLPHSDQVWASDLTARLADALEAAEAREADTEWEYGVLQGGGGHYVHSRGERTKAEAAVQSDRGDVLVCRTKASFTPVGLWVPVPAGGESNDK